MQKLLDAKENTMFEAKGIKCEGKTQCLMQKALPILPITKLIVESDQL